MKNLELEKMFCVRYTLQIYMNNNLTTTQTVVWERRNLALGSFYYIYFLNTEIKRLKF